MGKKTVEEIAGRDAMVRKVKIKGFVVRKNAESRTGTCLQHRPEKWKAYYVLLRILCLVQLLEQGSLLRQLAGGGRPSGVEAVR